MTNKSNIIIEGKKRSVFFGGSNSDYKTGKILVLIHEILERYYKLSDPILAKDTDDGNGFTLKSIDGDVRFGLIDLTCVITFKGKKSDNEINIINEIYNVLNNILCITSVSGEFNYNVNNINIEIFSRNIFNKKFLNKGVVKSIEYYDEISNDDNVINITTNKIDFSFSKKEATFKKEISIISKKDSVKLSEINLSYNAIDFIINAGDFIKVREVFLESKEGKENEKK